MPVDHNVLSLVLVLFTLLGSISTTGCLGQESRFSLVWIHGEERLEPEPDGYQSCLVEFDHEVRPAEETVRYSQQKYDFDRSAPSEMVSLDVWRTPSDCPVAYELIPEKNVTDILGDYGEISVSFEENGTAVIDDRRSLEGGENLTLSYSNEVGEGQWRNGTIKVEYYDDWSARGLKPVDA